MSIQEQNVNQRQREFYDHKKKKNLPTRIWSFFRNGILNKIRKNVGIEKQILDLHRDWIGDLSSKRVLDLGCYAGNSLSYYLAKNSREYVALDLSEKGISSLSRKIKDIPTATAITGDFFSPEFSYEGFDLIYAYGVLHHFKSPDLLILKLNEKLAPEGKIISYDPLETSLPIKIIRNIYRPFQTDKDWEWPFSKQTYYKFEKSFKIIQRRAILGKAKWFFILNVLPFSSEKKIAIAKKWHLEDWESSQVSNKYMFDCMHLTLLMQKK